MRARIKENRQKLVSIVETVVLSGRQNIAFRGNRDDNKSMSKLIGQHNILYLMDWTCRSYVASDMMVPAICMADLKVQWQSSVLGILM